MTDMVVEAAVGIAVENITTENVMVMAIVTNR